MTLQIALLLAGAVVVALVGLSLFDYGRMRNFLRRTSTKRVFGFRPDRGATTAPGLDINPTPAAVTNAKVLRSDASVAVEPKSAERDLLEKIEALEEVATMPLDLDPGLKPSRRHRRVRLASPDPGIDFVMSMPGEEPVVRNAALGIYKEYEYRIDKRHALYGMDHQTGQWTDVEKDAASASYRDLSIAVQLLDERGPIDESALNAFAQVGLKLADALQRPTNFSLPFEAALERAQALETFCGTYDVIAALNVSAPEGNVFRGRDIERLAAQAGMEFGARRIFHVKAEASPGCKHQFSMASMLQPGEFDTEQWDTLVVPGLTFFMHVPSAHRPTLVFERMAEVAGHFAGKLHGQLLDQDRRPINERGVAVIRHQIEEIEQAMRKFGVVPGSEGALRLFNAALGAEDVESAVAVHD